MASPARPIDLQEIHDVLVKLAQEAGAMMLEAQKTTRYTAEKMNSDVVTATDQAVEAHIASTLRARYPSFAFTGEETYAADASTASGPLVDVPTFICDPIDGTTNFVHGFPFYCVSLALAVRGVPVVGVILNPDSGDLFTAVEGRGAYCTRGGVRRRLPLGARAEEGGEERAAGAQDGRQAKTLTPPRAAPLGDLTTCLVGVEWGNDRTINSESETESTTATRSHPTNFSLKSRLYTRLAASRASGGAMTQSLRSIGSAALNCALVATGQLDAYWEAGPWAWDVAAGWVLVREAGGVVVGVNKGDWDVDVQARGVFVVRGAEGRGGARQAEDESKPSSMREEASDSQRRLIEEFWGFVGEERLVY